MYLLFVALTFTISACIGWFSIPRIVIIAKKKRLFDAPDIRKLHYGSIPRLGGLSFFPAALFSFAFVLGMRYHYGYDIALDLQINLLTELLFVISGMLILYFVGMADDLIGVGYRSKFLAQIVAGATVVYSGVTISDFQGFIGVYELPYMVDVTLTVLLVVLVINAFNLIDGVDGLCSGLGALILFALGTFFIVYELYVYAMFAFGMAGVLVVFFQYNVLGTRLKIFMGDTGSLTLGYMIVFLALKFLNISDTADVKIDTNMSTMAIMVGLIFVPLFDTLRVFVSRISRGRSPFHPDRNHIHHKLLNLDFTHMQSTGVLILVQFLFMSANWAMTVYAGMNVNVIIVIDLLVATGCNMCLSYCIAKRGRNINDTDVISKI